MKKITELIICLFFILTITDYSFAVKNIHLHYSFNAGEEFIQELNYDIVLIQSGNEASVNIQSINHLKILESDENSFLINQRCTDFEIREETNSFENTDLTLLGVYKHFIRDNLLRKGEEFIGKIGRDGRLLKTIKSPVKGFTSFALLPSEKVSLKEKYYLSNGDFSIENNGRKKEYKPLTVFEILKIIDSDAYIRTIFKARDGNFVDVNMITKKNP